MSDKVKSVYELAAIGYPGDIISKLVVGLPLTSEEEERAARAIANHQADKNITTAKRLNIM